MGFFGNVNQINADATKRYEQVLDIYKGLGEFATATASRALGIVRESSDKTLGLQAIAQEAKIDQAKTGKVRAEQAGYAAAGTDPLKTGQVAAAAAADTTVANLAMQGSQERIGIIDNQLKAELNVEQMKYSGQKGAKELMAGAMSSFQEQASSGYGGALLQLGGTIAGFHASTGRLPWQAKAKAKGIKRGTSSKSVF